MLSSRDALCDKIVGPDTGQSWTCKGFHIFIHGLHHVAELRETTAEGDTQTDVILRLDAQRPGGSQILISFTNRADHSLTVIHTRPNPMIQYALPRAELGEYLAKYPIGSRVVSSFVHPRGGVPNLRLTVYDPSAVQIRDFDASAVVASRIGAAAAKPVTINSVDNALLGDWMYGTTKYEIRNDGSYLVHGINPYRLENGGARLVWGPMVFLRLSGDSTQVAGHWLSDGLDEDVLLRTDGTYVWHTIGELDDAIGEWSTVGTNIESAELRATVATSGSDIEFDGFYSGTETGTYALSNGDQTLTITFASGLTVVYTRP